MRLGPQYFAREAARDGTERMNRGAKSAADDGSAQEGTRRGEEEAGQHVSAPLECGGEPCLGAGRARGRAEGKKSDASDAGRGDLAACGEGGSRGEGMRMRQRGAPWWQGSRREREGVSQRDQGETEAMMVRERERYAESEMTSQGGLGAACEGGQGDSWKVAAQQREVMRGRGSAAVSSSLGGRSHGPHERADADARAHEGAGPRAPVGWAGWDGTRRRRGEGVGRTGGMRARRVAGALGAWGRSRGGSSHSISSDGAAVDAAAAEEGRGAMGLRVALLGGRAGGLTGGGGGGGGP